MAVTDANDDCMMATHSVLAALHGAFTLSLLVANTLFFSACILAVIPLKVVAPTHGFRRNSYKLMEWLARAWVDGNTLILRLTQPTRWDVAGMEGPFERDGWYLIISNHRSWADILVLLSLFNRRTPFLKFFIKQELLWFPLLGLIWWALDYPFMKRYSREYLRKHPEKMGKDLETTRRACEKFKDTPVSILNFLEGTRFTQAKHNRQQSPFRHLLLPKAGGIAFVLSAMGERFKEIINVTLVYPVKDFNFWHLLSGRLPKLVVRVQRLAVPPEAVIRDYELDSEFKKFFQNWVNRLWREKDQLIEELTVRSSGTNQPLAHE